MGTIVKNTSKAYGYNYASLGDIANQGFTIPRMKTGTENGKEYVYCYDPETKEWIRGAEIVVPNMKGMNESQQYGSALTYARRYSVLLYLGLCCDDDKKLETEAPKGKKSGIFDDPILELAKEFRAVCPMDEQARILNGLNITKAEDMSVDFLQKYIAFYKKKNETQADIN